jgi:hypothetical protein
VIHLHCDGDGLTRAEHRAALELFQADVAPVLRRQIPSRPLAAPIRLTEPPSTPSSAEEREQLAVPTP